METITEKQSNCIHTLLKQLGWTDYIYRSWLAAYYKVNSSSELEVDKASALIADLKMLLEQQEADRKPKPASFKQVAKIKYMWLDVDYSKGECGDKHLSVFLEKRFHVKKTEELTCKQADTCIRTIKAMQEQAKKREGQTTILHRRTVCKYCGLPIMWVQLADGRRMPFDFDSNDKATDFHGCTDKGYGTGR